MSDGNLKRNLILLDISMSTLNIGIAVATTLLSVYLNILGFSGTDIGLVNAITAIATGFMFFLAGKVSDAIGRRIPIVASCLLTAVVGATIYFTSNPFVVILMMVMNGVSLGIRTPAYIALISESENANRVTFSFSVFYTATLIGSLLGTIPSGILVDFYGFSFTFLLLAIFSLAAVPFAWFLQEPHSFSDKVGQEKLESKMQVPLKGFYEIIKENRSLLFFAIAIMFHSFSFSVIYPYIPLYALKDINLNNTETGIVISIWHIGLLLTQIPFGRLADKKGASLILLAHFILSSIVWTIFPFSASFLGAMVAILLFGIVGSMDMPSRRTLISQLSAQGELASTVGYVGFLVELAGVVGYAFGGFLWDNISHTSPFFLAAAVNIVGVLLLMKVRASQVRR